MPHLVDGCFAHGDRGAVDEDGAGVAGEEDEGQGGEHGSEPDEEAGLEHGGGAGGALCQGATRHTVALQADGQDGDG